MSCKRFALLILVMSLAVATLGGCRRDGTNEVSSTEKSSNTGAAATQSDLEISASPPRESLALTSDDAIVKLEGLTLEIPSGWGRPVLEGGQFSQKTVLALPKADGDENDGSVEITHFPGMKGMDEQNIQRWIGFVIRSDGSRHTRETAQVTVAEIGPVRLTTIDLSGTVRTSMFGASNGMPDHRMIAAIVDHPRGPHFIKAIAGTSTMKKWAQSVEAFLHSAALSTD